LDVSSKRGQISNYNSVALFLHNVLSSLPDLGPANDHIELEEIIMKFKNIILFFALFPSAALANRADADVCAKSLSTNSKIIYKAAVDRVVPGEVQQNKEMLRELVEEMINSGKITIDEAYPSAMAAANCLKKMNIGYELIDKKKTP